MPKGNPVAFRFPDSLDMARIDEKADMFGMSRSAFVMTAIELLLDFDPDSYIKIKNYANRVNIPMGLIMQNIVIKELARKAALADVWGSNFELQPELKKDNQTNSYIMGDELFFEFYKKYMDEFINNKIRVLVRAEQDMDLDDEDKAFLKKHRAGKVWLESEEFKQEVQLLEKSIEKPSSFKGSEEDWLEFRKLKASILLRAEKYPNTPLL